MVICGVPGSGKTRLARTLIVLSLTKLFYKELEFYTFDPLEQKPVDYL